MKVARPVTFLDQLCHRRDTTRQAAEQILIRAADEQRDHTPDELAEHRYYIRKIIGSTSMIIKACGLDHCVQSTRSSFGIGVISPCQSSVWRRDHIAPLRIDSNRQ